MALVVSESLERRIQAIVEAGVYPTAEQALQAAVELVEAFSSNDFDGGPDDVAALIEQGVQTRLLNEEEFWRAADGEFASGCSGES
jgi:Arc/MetJ-type ribon-helix-helix transcriptional regulator